VRRLGIVRLLAPCAVAALIFLPKVLWPGLGIYQSTLTPRVLNCFRFVLEFGPLCIGAVFAARWWLRTGPGDPVRLPWLLLACFFAASAAGQACLSYYDIVRFPTPTPFPSIGDALFLLGNSLGLFAALLFLRAYAGSGFPLGPRWQYGAIIGAAALGLGLVSFNLLPPIASASAPALERAVNIAYPVSDFLLIIPALVLLRIGLAFRPGGVWKVWASLATGFVFMAAGDILFSYETSLHLERIGKLIDLLYVVSYTAAAYGVVLQNEMSGASELDRED
jgi:hypothetical protein